jgi:hypothetical protein
MQRFSCCLAGLTGFFLFLPLTSCRSISERNRDTAILSLDTSLAAGYLTPAQHAFAVEAIRRGAVFDWDKLGTAATELVNAMLDGRVVGQ